jgi:hypothetical protein
VDLYGVLYGTLAAYPEADRAARVILDGVARNRAVIAFPGYVRLAWRTSCLFPRILDRAAPRQLREARRYRTADHNT